MEITEKLEQKEQRDNILEESTISQQVAELYFCTKCGCLEVEQTSTGEVLCKNKHCLAITKVDVD